MNVDDKLEDEVFVMNDDKLEDEVFM